MQRTIHIALMALTTSTFLSLQAQVPLPQSAIQGSSVMTNYATTGPGLPASSLFESRMAQPAGVPASVSVTSSAGMMTPGVGRGGAVVSTVPRGPLEPIPVAPLAGDIPFHPESPSYTFPGLVTRFSGAWVGSDYLYNLPPDIGVAVDIIMPDNFPLRIDARRIKDAVADIFSRGNITPVSQAVGDHPPLPFLHILIFAQAAEESTVAFVEARYFEGVKLFRLDYVLPGTVQAITWEKQDLLVDAPNRIAEQIFASAEGLARDFVSRVHFFQRQRLEQEELLRLRCGSFSPLSGGRALPPKPRRQAAPAAVRGAAAPTPRAAPTLTPR
jgi:hypothetical protein